MTIDPESLNLKNLNKAILVGVYSSSSQKALSEDYLKELERLCETYGWQVVATFPCMLRKIDAATYLSKGKVEQLAQMVIDLEVDVVVFDDEISPHQQRNLEKLLKYMEI
jgi:GTP-binding protein HflX